MNLPYFLHFCIKKYSTESSKLKLFQNILTIYSYSKKIELLDQFFDYKKLNLIDSVQLSSVAQLCPTLCNPMERSMPGLPVHHQLLEFIQTHVHGVSDAIQPSHPLSFSSPEREQDRMVLAHPSPYSLPAFCL